MDKRADIWAFGVVLYEMLAGKPPFSGSTLTDVLAAILEREPDWQALPASVPFNITCLVRKCLEKDARSRLRDIGDARIELEDTLTGASTQTAGKARAPVLRRAVAAAIAAGLALGAVATWMIARNLEPESAPASPVARFAVSLSPNEIVHPIGGNSYPPGSTHRIALLGWCDEERAGNECGRFRLPSPGAASTTPAGVPPRTVPPAGRRHSVRAPRRLRQYPSPKCLHNSG